jgi:hypothetical protein
MPNYIVYDPATTPVAGLVLSYLRSFPEEKESDLGVNRLKNPDLTGVTISNPMKVVSGAVVNLSTAEITQINNAQAAANLAEMKQASKDIYLTPSSSHNHAIKWGMESLAEVVVDELNLIRANFSPAMTARNYTQAKTAFRTKYEAKIDALS